MSVPYGGGAGIVLLKPEPVIKAIVAAKEKLANLQSHLYYPCWKVFKQSEKPKS
ncbi:MAG: hypothetical protein R3A13_04915 [Bdellovibrionota bacterium]